MRELKEDDVKILERLFFRRPRVLNQLHRAHLIDATSQTNQQELATLARYAQGKRCALEIGTYQGVSAVRIAGALAPAGTLFCVDPWPEVNGHRDPCWLICERHLRRSGLLPRVKILRGFSWEIQDALPNDLDFAFIDGDHSWNGIETDWKIVALRLVDSGVVCLHDVITPADEPWRQLDSVRFYRERVANDEAFETIDIVHSMAVLRKR